MGEFTQKRLIRKLDLELFLAKVAPQPTPQAHLEQYTVSERLAANMLYIAAYSNNDIIGKSVLDLGCGTGRLALGAAFLGAESVVGIDIDRVAIKTARENSTQSCLANKVEWVNGKIDIIAGKFDTVVQNPPFGVQTREADRAFLVKALEVGDVVYSLHNHPETDERLIKMLKSSQGFVQVEPSPFLQRLISKHHGAIQAVYALPMTIPRMFDFHKKIKHDFIIDLYVIRKQANQSAL
ncbi:MAG TPA: METTL5 family protein [Candidatus Deferrimicrobiaceae bacterium]|nr:METTL5 family protein [Candidatus Deferrimicrobiaceae bacterium]